MISPVLSSREQSPFRLSPSKRSPVAKFQQSELETPPNVSQLSLAQKLKLFQEQNLRLAKNIDTTAKESVLKPIEGFRNINSSSTATRPIASRGSHSIRSRVESQSSENKVLLQSYTLAKKLATPGQSVPSAYEIAFYKKQR